MSSLGLDRHAFERVLFLAPMVWAGFLFGWRGAFITSLAALLSMLPRALFISLHPIDALFETAAVFIIGNVVAISFASLRKEREYRTRLEISRQEQQEIAEELSVTQRNLRFYLQQATRAQEEERKRISHELHDDTIQALVVLSRQLDSLASGDKGLSEENRLRLEELWQQTDNILKGVRRLSQDLRPAALDRLGLLPALEWLASNVAEHSGIATGVKVVGKERRLSEEAAIALFRITQEAMRNVWRHSGANSAEITVEFDESKTRITITDNGEGFDLPEDISDLAKNGKLGLTGMQERAQLVGGTLKVQSQPGKGTIITVDLPS
ncbi:MAG: sensor histidine kinase [Deltaproteobacteria bacterium]|nr:sensor histidine kinase [Deltaproteobacteria bacterium]